MARHTRTARHVANAAPAQPRPAPVDPWGGAQPTALPNLPLLDLVADGGVLGALSHLSSTGQVSLASTLAAWQREQERLATRAWRRPGGLLRPGGL